MKRSPLQRKSELKRSSPLESGYPRPRKRHTKRKDSEYTKELREYIAERDEWCQICGGRGDQVHHVIPRGRYKVHPEWYSITHVHDERNLMWVCWKCHIQITSHNDLLEEAIQLQERRFGPLRKLEEAQV